MPPIEDPVTLLVDTFMPDLEWAAKRLRAEFPRHTIRTYSHSVGSKTTFQGYDVGIDCLIPDVDDLERPDGVCIGIGIRHITTEPLIDGADVCWNHPSGHLELALVRDPVPLTQDRLIEVKRQLPQLVDALRGALLRGRPPSA